MQLILLLLNLLFIKPKINVIETITKITTVEEKCFDAINKRLIFDFYSTNEIVVYFQQVFDIIVKDKNLLRLENELMILIQELIKYLFIIPKLTNNCDFKALIRNLTSFKQRYNEVELTLNDEYISHKFVKSTNNRFLQIFSHEITLNYMISLFKYRKKLGLYMLQGLINILSKTNLEEILYLLSTKINNFEMCQKMYNEELIKSYVRFFYVINYEDQKLNDLIIDYKKKYLENINPSTKDKEISERIQKVLDDFIFDFDKLIETSLELKEILFENCSFTENEKLFYHKEKIESVSQELINCIPFLILNQELLPQMLLFENVINDFFIKIIAKTNEIEKCFEMESMPKEVQKEEKMSTENANDEFFFEVSEEQCIENENYEGIQIAIAELKRVIYAIYDNYQSAGAFSILKNTTQLKFFTSPRHYLQFLYINMSQKIKERFVDNSKVNVNDFLNTLEFKCKNEIFKNFTNITCGIKQVVKKSIESHKDKMNAKTLDQLLEQQESKSEAGNDEDMDVVEWIKTVD